MRIYLIALFALFSSFLTSQTDQIYHTSWDTDGYIMGGAAALLAVDIYLDHNITPLTVEDLATVNSEGINAFDRSAIFKYSQSASDLSDLFKDVTFIVPLTLFLGGKAQNEARSIGIMYIETFAVTSAITQATKALVGRKRPFVYNPDVALDVKLAKNGVKSFYSGHTSHVASLSFFTATVFSDLYPESNWKYAVWAGAVLSPAITAYARYEGGRHFPTDVIVGYGVGALVGYLIPRLHRSSHSKSISLHPIGNGLGLTMQF